MTRNIVAASLIALIILVSIVLYKNQASPSLKTIAIVTTLSHPALDAARRGFIDALSLDGNVKVVEYNAEGNVQQANLIAHKIASDENVIGIFAIGTLAALTTAKNEHHKPIVIAAVSDPSMITDNNPHDNVCGLSDEINADYQIDTLITIMPTLKNIALLYSPHEENSVAMVKNLKQTLAKRGLASTLNGVHETQQIMMASLDACKKADAILIPLDNQLVASMPAVIKATKNLPCPVVTSNESPIHQGAALAFGVDYQKSGEHAGMLMSQILKGETSPKDIGFIAPKTIEFYVNDEVLRQKDIAIDDKTQRGLIHISDEAPL